MVAHGAFALLAAPLRGTVAAAPVEVAVLEVLDEAVAVGGGSDSFGSGEGGTGEVGGGSKVRHCGTVGFGSRASRGWYLVRWILLCDLVC